MQIIPTGKGETASLWNPGQPGGGAATQEKEGFRRLLAEVHQQQRQADAEVHRTLLGEGELHDALLALEKANLGLRLLVQVRNKLVAAYEELSRMSM